MGDPTNFHIKRLVTLEPCPCAAKKFMYINIDYNPENQRLDTRNDGLEKVTTALNMAIFGI